MAEQQTMPIPFLARAGVTAGIEPSIDPRLITLPEYSLEEMMPVGELQDKASFYLKDVLHRQFQEENWYIALELLLLCPRVSSIPIPKLVPDVALFIDVVRPESPENPITSWTIDPPLSPPPTVVFEIASDASWRKDLDTKAPTYALMGVSEYYSYDPRPEAKRPRQERGKPRLRGWACDRGIAVEMTPHSQQRLWSPILDSFVVPDGNYLRLFDASGIRRPTGEEAECLAKEQALHEKDRALHDKDQALHEKDQALHERDRALYEKDRLAARLRELGIDPESLT